jgi:polysaccharide export outer membrane protein
MKTFPITLSAFALIAAAAVAAAQSPSAPNTSTPSTSTPGASTPSTPSPSTPRPAGTSGSTTTNGGTAAPMRARSADIMPEYRLVPGDKLRIEVYKDPQVSQSVQVRPDGKITLPLANDIMAAGHTPIELRDLITESLKSYIANPTVTVIVVETTPPVFYVMGEVNNSGPQALVGRVDVLQALSAAGGFKDFADTKDIRIRRGSKIIRFNYNDAIKGQGSPVFLQPGDTIIVP